MSHRNELVLVTDCGCGEETLTLHLDTLPLLSNINDTGRKLDTECRLAGPEPVVGEADEET